MYMYIDCSYPVIWCVYPVNVSLMAIFFFNMSSGVLSQNHNYNIYIFITVCLQHRNAYLNIEDLVTMIL